MRLISALLSFLLGFTPNFALADCGSASVTPASAKEAEATLADLKKRCADPNQVSFAIPERRPGETPTSQNVSYPYLTLKLEGENCTGSPSFFDCRGVGLLPVIQDPKTEASSCDGCEASDKNLQEISRVSSEIKTSAIKTCDAGQAKQSAVACVEDLACHLIPTLANGEKNCSTAAPSCAVTVLSGIVKNIVFNVKGLWSLLDGDTLIRMANGAVSAAKGVAILSTAVAKDAGTATHLLKVKLSSLFANETVQDIEDRTSNSALVATTLTDSEVKQLAINASQGAIIAAKKVAKTSTDFLGNSFGCEKWSGLPYVSECLGQFTEWKCASCGQRMNAICGVGGLLAGEVIIAFLTGGTLNIAGKASKVIKASTAFQKTLSIAKANTTVQKLTRAGGLAGKMTKTANAISYSYKKINAVLKKFPVLNAYLHLTEKAFLFGLYGKNYKTIKTALEAEKSTQILNAEAKKANIQPRQRRAMLTKLPEVVKTENVRRQLSMAAVEDMRARSKTLTKIIKKQNYPVYDVALVGGGIHGTIIGNNIKNANASMRVITFEATDSISQVWGQAGKTFRINSPEVEGLSANMFPNSPVQLKDFAKDKFVDAQSLGDVAAIAQYFSENDLLLNQKVTKVFDRLTSTAKDVDKWPARYKIQTADGVTVYANQIGVAPGLGIPKAKFDEATNVLIDTERTAPQNSTSMPRIMYSDEFLQRAHRMADDGIGAQKAFVNQTTAVVGPGDGGKIAIENLIGQAPQEHYVGEHVEKGKGEIYWVGQKAKTGEKFKETTYERYHGVAEAIDSGLVKPVADKLSEIQKIKDGPDKGRFRLVFTAEKDKPPREVIVDRIIVATGYEQQYQKLLQGIKPGGEISTVPVVGHADGIGDSTNLGVRVQVNGATEQDIFVYGPGAGPLATHQELDATITHNPVSINVLAPRTAGLAQKIAEAKPILTARQVVMEKGLKLPSESNYLIKSTGFKVQAIEGERDTLDLLLKVRFAEAAKAVELNGPVHVNFTATPTGAIQLVGQGMSPENVVILGKQLENDKEFQRIIVSKFKSGNKTVSIAAPLSASGRAMWDQVKIVGE